MQRSFCVFSSCADTPPGAAGVAITAASPVQIQEKKKDGLYQNVEGGFIFQRWPSLHRALILHTVRQL